MNISPLAGHPPPPQMLLDVSTRITAYYTLVPDPAVPAERVRVRRARHCSRGPNIDTDKPVSRQHEREYNQYYGYPYYWSSATMWGMGVYPGLLAGAGWKDVPTEKGDQATGNTHLRSASELRHYHVQGTDDAIGHVADFIADDATWGVRYLVVDTSNWWLGRKVLIRTALGAPSQLEGSECAREHDPRGDQERSGVGPGAGGQSPVRTTAVRLLRSAGVLGERRSSERSAVVDA